MIWTAIILGFAGSLHCLGMCAPLAMAVTNVSPKAFVNRTIYNAGRISTYAILGSIVASVGVALPMFRYQNVVSIILGIVLMIVGLSGTSVIKIPFITGALGSFSVFLKSLFSHFLAQKNYGSTFLLGSLNGFLPCGLSFLALTYCLTLAGPLDGFNFMMLFGVGTLPVMLGFTTVFQLIVTRLHITSKRLTTSMLVISGMLLIARVFLVHIPHATDGSRNIVDIVLCQN